MFAKILLPIDLAETELTKGVVEAAASLARAFGTELRIVNIQSLIPVAYMDYVSGDFDADIKRGLEKELLAVAQGLDLPQERVSTALLFGPVHQKVLSEAKDWGADMIVLGSHQPAPERFLIGSNASAIVSRAHCAVMVVRS